MQMGLFFFGGLVFFPFIAFADIVEPNMVLIPQGPFLYGSSTEERVHYTVSINEPIQQTIVLDAYWIGKFETTNEEFEQFIDDGGYNTPRYWMDTGWEIKEKEGWTEPRRWHDKDYRGEKRIRYPACALSWYEADAYCRWLAQKTGKPYRLPSGQEWEKAARGTEGNIFPWGNFWEPAYCNWLADTDGDRLPNDSIDGFLRTAPVGNYDSAPSPYGCFDMAGNVLEWCSDRLGSNRQYRMFRGGCFLSGYPRLLRCAWQGGTAPDIGHVYWGIIGFRVAMDTVEDVE